MISPNIFFLDNYPAFEQGKDYKDFNLGSSPGPGNKLKFGVNSIKDCIHNYCLAG